MYKLSVKDKRFIEKKHQQKQNSKKQIEKPSNSVDFLA